MEIPAGASSALVSAVEANHIEVLVLNPNSAQEAAFAGLRQRRNVKNQAPHVAKKFAAYIVKLIVLGVESAGIDEDHLQETVRQELHGERKEVAERFPANDLH